MTASKELTGELIRSLREGDGCPVEADSELNDASRRVVQEVHDTYGEAWLGNINLYIETRGKPVIWKWDGSTVCNFSCAFVLRAYDAELERLILERDYAPYTGGREDYKRIEQITSRIAEIGGELLVWS